MKLLTAFTIVLLCMQAHSISSLSFVKGEDVNFNRVFIKKFLSSAVSHFSIKGKGGADFQKEVQFFIDNESANLYFGGDAEKVQRTKFGLKFNVEDEDVKQVFLRLYSDKKTLSTWDLNTFTKVAVNHSGRSEALPTSCKALGLEAGKADYYSENLTTGDCQAFVSETSFSHPIFKGKVNLYDKGGVAYQPIVKRMAIGMTKVPRKVRAFSQKWRLPPSRFFNRQKTSELYLP